MIPRSLVRSAGALGFFFALSILVSCGRDKAPVAPRSLPWDASTAAVEPMASTLSALDALWPNEDGRSWQYDVFWCSTIGTGDAPIYSTREQVPPAPDVI